MVGRARLCDDCFLECAREHVACAALVTAGHKMHGDPGCGGHITLIL